MTIVSSQRKGEVMAPSRAGESAAKINGVDLREVRQTIHDFREQSDGGRSFAAALEDKGLTLAKGDRRDFIVIDHEGGMHALGKRITGIPAAEMRTFMADIDREKLPTVEQAREQIAERAPGIVHAGDLAWEDALAKAAIDKK